MGRRSLNGGDPVPRPRPPLLHRISPADKAMAVLEADERELETYRRELDSETYERMRSILWHKRQALDKRMRRAEGLPPSHLEDLVRVKHPNRKPIGLWLVQTSHSKNWTPIITLIFLVILFKIICT